MSKFKTLKDKEEYIFDIRKLLRHRCCNCGDVHYIKFSIISPFKIRIVFAHKKEDLLS